MRKTINTKELRSSLPQIVESIKRGEQFTVLYRSRPAFRIVPIHDEDRIRCPLSKDPLYHFGALGESTDNFTAADHDEMLYGKKGKMKRLFVDTAGWMAMADAKDPLHKQSISFRDEWLEENGIVVISNFIIDETLTLIRMRLGIEAARVWWQAISDSPRCIKEWITPERTEKAVNWFLNWQDQSFSFTDCTSFVVMRELGIADALTADRHFMIAGFQIHP